MALKITRPTILVISSLLVALAFLPQIISNEVYAIGFSDFLQQNCVESNTCDWSARPPFEMFLQPYLLTIGSWIYVCIWAIIVGILYMRSTPINAGVAGLIIAATLTGSQFTSEFPVFQEAIRLGIILFALSLAFMAWVMFKSRIQGNG